MTSAEGHLVVLGLGNILLGDDGAGVRVVEGLRAVAEHDPRALPAGTRLVDGGTLGLDVLPAIQGAGGLVVVDAARLGGAAGAVTVLRQDAIEAAAGPGGGPAPGVIGELLATTRFLGVQTGPVSLVGIEPADVDPGLQLSDSVSRALPVAISAVRDELRRLDVSTPSTTHGGTATAGMAGTPA